MALSLRFSDGVQEAQFRQAWAYSRRWWDVAAVATSVAIFGSLFLTGHVHSRQEAAKHCSGSLPGAAAARVVTSPEGWMLLGAIGVSSSVLVTLAAEALHPPSAFRYSRRERLLLLHRIMAAVYLCFEVAARLPAATAASGGGPADACAAQVASRTFGALAQHCCGRVALLVSLGAVCYMSTLHLQIGLAAGAWALSVLTSAVVDSLLFLPQPGGAAAVAACFSDGAAAGGAACTRVLAPRWPQPRLWYASSAAGICALWAVLRWHERRLRRRWLALSDVERALLTGAQPAVGAAAAAGAAAQATRAPKEGRESDSQALLAASAEGSPRGEWCRIKAQREPSDAVSAPGTPVAAALPPHHVASVDAVADVGAATSSASASPRAAGKPSAQEACLAGEEAELWQQSASQAASLQAARAPRAASPLPAPTPEPEYAPALTLAPAAGSEPPAAAGAAQAEAVAPGVAPLPAAPVLSYVSGGGAVAPPLYESPASTMLFGVKVRGMPGVAGGLTAVADATALPAAASPGTAAASAAPAAAAADGMDSEAVQKALEQLQAYELAAARVRAAVQATIAQVVSNAGLQVLRCSVTTFPGCVHAILALALPPTAAHNASGAALAAALHRGVLRQLAPRLPAAAAAALRVEVGLAHAGDAALHAAGMHMQPAVLALGDESEDSNGATVVAVVLPEGLRAYLAAAGCGVRVVVTVEGAAVPLADARWRAGALPADGQLRVTLREAPSAPLAQVAVLSVNRGTAAAERLLGQLPLLALPAAAAHELSRAFEAMTRRLGSPAGAYRQHFAPLARDMGALLTPTAAAGANVASPAGVVALAAALERFLQAHSARAVLVLLQAQPAWPAAALAEAAAVMPLPGAPAPEVRAGGGDAKATLSSPADVKGSGLKGCSVAALAAGAGASPCGRSTGATGGKRRAAPLELPAALEVRHLLFGFPGAGAEEAYGEFKARERHGADVALFCVKTLKDVLSAFKLAPVAQLPGLGPPIGVISAILVAGSVPYLVLLAAPRAFHARRDAYIGAARCACGVLAIAPLPVAHLRAAAIEMVGRLYQRPAPALIWGYGVIPALQQLRPRAQLACSALHIAHGYTMLWLMQAAAGALAPWRLLAQVCACEVCACVMVAVLDARCRRRFLRVQAAHGRAPRAA